MKGRRDRREGKENSEVLQVNPRDRGRVCGRADGSSADWGLYKIS